MRGTEKQINWASEIKASITEALEQMSNTSRKAEYDQFRAWLDAKQDASWWISLWKQTNTNHMFLRCAIIEWKKSEEEKK